MSNTPDFYQKLEVEDLNPSLLQFQSGVISDAAVRQHFLLFAQKIEQHYRFLGQPTGNLNNYLQAMQIGNPVLDEMRDTKLGYFNLLSFVKSYVFNKLQGKETFLPGKLRDAGQMAKKDNKKNPDGKTRLLEINTDAERDLLKLIVRYVEFFFTSSECKARFDQHAINLGLKLPIKKLINERIAKFKQRILDYDNDKTITGYNTQRVAKLEEQCKKLKENKAYGYNPTTTSSETLRIISEARYKRILTSLNLMKSKPQQTAELTQKRTMANNIINDYIKKTSFFNFYGKKRAIELRNDLARCTKLDDLDKKTMQFIHTGKTKSDYSRFNFFRSIRRRSGRGENALRGMLIRACS